MAMKAPEWIGPAIGGAIVGAIAIAIVGFSADWVFTAADAERRAERTAEKAVIAALTPVCVEQFKKTSEATQDTHLAALKKEDTWQRGDYVEDQGWAKVPSNPQFSDDVAEACSEQLLKASGKTSDK